MGFEKVDDVLQNFLIWPFARDMASQRHGHCESFLKYANFLFKGLCFYETRPKIFSLPWRGKVVFEFWPLRQCWAVGPIQI